jgi:hypothetical protein
LLPCSAVWQSSELLAESSAAYALAGLTGFPSLKAQMRVPAPVPELGLEVELTVRPAPPPHDRAAAMSTKQVNVATFDLHIAAEGF